MMNVEFMVKVSKSVYGQALVSNPKNLPQESPKKLKNQEN